MTTSFRLLTNNIYDLAKYYWLLKATTEGKGSIEQLVDSIQFHKIHNLEMGDLIDLELLLTSDHKAIIEHIMRELKRKFYRSSFNIELLEKHFSSSPITTNNSLSIIGSKSLSPEIINYLEKKFKKIYWVIPSKRDLSYLQIFHQDSNIEFFTGKEVLFENEFFNSNTYLVVDGPTPGKLRSNTFFTDEEMKNYLKWLERLEKSPFERKCYLFPRKENFIGVLKSANIKLGSKYLDQISLDEKFTLLDFNIHTKGKTRIFYREIEKDVRISDLFSFYTDGELDKILFKLDNMKRVHHLQAGTETDLVSDHFKIIRNDTISTQNKVSSKNKLKSSLSYTVQGRDLVGIGEIGAEDFKKFRQSAETDDFFSNGEELLDGDILMSRITRGHTPLLAIVKNPHGGCYASNGLYIIRPKGSYSSDLLLEIFKSKYGKERLIENANMVGRVQEVLSISAKSINTLAIPKIEGQVKEVFFKTIAESKMIVEEAQRNLDEKKQLSKELQAKAFKLIGIELKNEDK